MNTFILALMAALALLGFASLFAGLTSVVERKIAGRMQSRVGPNYVFAKGFGQFLADGLKILQKEDIIPRGADRLLFRLAPYLVFTGMFLSFLLLPFASGLVAADFDAGILFLLSFSSLNVVGIVMSGWASNNKWSLIGGMRSAAQMISYEIPAALAILCVVLLSGSLSLQSIITAQGPWPHQWYLMSDPVSFFILFIALLAEGNRAPFDLPEAESELVSGFNTEYSGFRFLFFFFAEWANLYIISAVLVSLFLGGWNSPVSIELNTGLSLQGMLGFERGRILSFELTGLALFFLKVTTLTFFIIQLRWTLPRFRIDQLLTLCWKGLIPLAFVNMLFLMTRQLFSEDALFPIITTVVFSMAAAAYLIRILWSFYAVRARPDVNFFP
jgi:NADH-quinone oxidoreductase subunit H